ncbi:MAG: hypothetical protein ABI995_15030 [Acidobacteriota bacterium]
MRARFVRNAVTAVIGLTLAAAAHAQQPAKQLSSSLTWEQKEEFLKKAKVTVTKSVSKGITGTSRVTLSDGKTTHDASVQTIDEHQTVFQPQGGKTELNFKDTYRFNTAAWKLARLIGLESMIPPSVDRSFGGKSAAFTWWIDDVQMDEGERQKKNASSPNSVQWQQDSAMVKVFDQLIANTDRNVGNLQIDKDWRIWMIDHTRAFRSGKDLTSPASLTLIDRNVLAKLKDLDQNALAKELKGFADGGEVKALLARRDAIVKIFEAKGESALFTMTPRN